MSPIQGSPSVNTPNTNEGNPLPDGIAPDEASAVPCDVAAILSKHCTTCHGSTPQFNAPMSVTSAKAFSAPLPARRLR